LFAGLVGLALVTGCTPKTQIPPPLSEDEEKAHEQQVRESGASEGGAGHRKMTEKVDKEDQ
jgi:hypothetical protein